MADDAIKTPDAGDLLDDLMEQEPDLGTLPFQLRARSDSLAVLVDCPDPLSAIGKWTERIHAELEKLEISETPSLEIIKSLLVKSCEPGQDLMDHILIQGQPATLSQSSKVAWSRDFFAEGWQIDETTGKINYREKVENCAVNRNELLLRVHNAVEGEPGVDIYGNPIAVEKPEVVKIRCGKGVSEVTESEAVAYYSDLDGRVRFTDNTLSVDEVYHVTGNVGLASGNIYHPGSVTIDGDVLADSIIEADGDVVVKGMVEESIIICGGELTVAGGILGGEGHKIRAGSDIEAKYIRDADVACDGHVRVTKQISHSRVRCLGQVLVPNGRIAGGTIQARQGIRVATAGAPGAAETLLMSGVDYTLQAQIDLYSEKIKRLEATLVPIDNALQNAGDADRDLSEGVQQVVENMALKRLKLKDTIVHQQGRIAKLREASLVGAEFYVVMTKEVWSGTTIYLGEAKTFVKKSIAKPRVVLLRENRARVLPLGEENMPPELGVPGVD